MRKLLDVKHILDSKLQKVLDSQKTLKEQDMVESHLDELQSKVEESSMSTQYS